MFPQPAVGRISAGSVWEKTASVEARGCSDNAVVITAFSLPAKPSVWGNTGSKLTLKH